MLSKLQSVSGEERVGQTSEEAVRKIENCKKNRKEGISVQITEEGQRAHWRSFKKEKLDSGQLKLKLRLKLKLKLTWCWRGSLKEET